MKKELLMVLCIFLLFNKLYPQVPQGYFKYLEPLPNAKYVNKEATIIIKPYETINKESLNRNGAITLTGTLSGICSFQIVWSDDNKTLILKPSGPFILGETITVKFTGAIRNLKGESIKPFSYSFEIKSKEVYITKQLGLESEISTQELMRSPNAYYNNDLVQSFPNIALNYYNNPAFGQIFMSNFALGPSTSYLIILNNNAQPFYTKQMPAPCFDFNVQPNGNITYFDGRYGKYFEMDSNYNVIDSFYTGNGYTTDLHELRLLTNRHAFLMSYDSQHVDMSLIVAGGNPNAVVSGLIIQEIDANKHVVFQWRSWDHFQITDATHEDLRGDNVDYVHGNAIEIDNDGNIMISSRHMDEITKINRTTGDIIWRLGGFNNQFTFVNDPIKFSYQHGIRRLKNGNIMLYDNGNYHIPQISRAVEYRLDETNKIATLVWQYRNSPDIFGQAMGFAQRLDNNNTLIAWGFTSPTVTEVRYDGTKTLEISLPQGTFTYRAFRHKWKNAYGQLVPDAFSFGQNFPNPFNPYTTIKFAIPNVNSDNSPIDVKLAVYDILGREVATIVNEKLYPDTYYYTFNGSNLTSGVYFYRLLTPQFSETKKMIILK